MFTANVVKTSYPPGCHGISETSHQFGKSENNASGELSPSSARTWSAFELDLEIARHLFLVSRLARFAQKTLPKHVPFFNWLSLLSTKPHTNHSPRYSHCSHSYSLKLEIRYSYLDSQAYACSNPVIYMQLIC